MNKNREVTKESSIEVLTNTTWSKSSDQKRSCNNSLGFVSKRKASTFVDAYVLLADDFTSSKTGGEMRLFTCSVCLMITDEVDVIGYTSNQSDTDDHSSVQSSSDSGVAMSTSRLTLSEMMDNL
ncbi:hypothetical protein WN51_01966 [Melipona quadrifasciata]|uniref:Uncharacterized protein n=1 Tax=Melipona quadrifasciata TaxID=166423 RepID=A0A0N0U7G6_9HYME|nr:hypothetical protein WN51_01966 [Melipona quadrifasciata]